MKFNIPGPVPDELTSECCSHFQTSVQHFYHSCTTTHTRFNRKALIKANTPACCSSWASGSAPTATTLRALSLRTWCGARKRLCLTGLLPARRHREGCCQYHWKQHQPVLHVILQRSVQPTRRGNTMLSLQRCIYKSSGVWDAVILALFIYRSVVDLNGYRSYTPSMQLTHFSLWWEAENLEDKHSFSNQGSVKST